MRVAVTGAASKGGVVISQMLGSAGHEVRAGLHAGPRRDRASAGREDCAVAATATRCHPIDMLRLDTLAPFFDGVDAAVLILPQDRSMVAMAANLVAAAEQAGIGRLVLVSFTRVDGAVGGSVLRWHHDVEQLVRGSGMTATCLRPNFYMQNFLSAFRPTPALNEGLISYVDARDVADVALSVLAEPRLQGATYSLTGPRAYEVEEVMRVLEGEVGPPVTLASIGWDQVCSSTRRSAHAPEVQALCEVWQAATEGYFSPVTTDVEQVLGRPARSLEAFARDHRGQCRRIVSIAGAPRRCA